MPLVILESNAYYLLLEMPLSRKDWFSNLRW